MDKGRWTSCRSPGRRGYIKEEKKRLWETVGAQTARINMPVREGEGGGHTWITAHIDKKWVRERQWSTAWHCSMQTCICGDERRQWGILKRWWEGEKASVQYASLNPDGVYSLHVCSHTGRVRTEMRKNTMQLREKPLVYPRYPRRQTLH